MSSLRVMGLAIGGNSVFAALKRQHRTHGPCVATFMQN